MNVPARVHEVAFRVRYAETDAMGFAYHTHYLVWCEVGRTGLLREAGRSYAELERDGIFLAVSEADIRYHAPARYEDPVRVQTWLTELRSRGVAFEYRIAHAETDRTFATARTRLVCLGRDGRPRTLPHDLRALLRTWVTPRPARNPTPPPGFIEPHRR